MCHFPLASLSRCPSSPPFPRFYSHKQTLRIKIKIAHLQSTTASPVFNLFLLPKHTSPTLFHKPFLNRPHIKIPFSLGSWVSSSLFLSSIAMATSETTIAEPQIEKNVYSVWAIPPDDVSARLKKLMEGLRAEFGGPQFEPHITVVGAISLTADEAVAKFRSACEGVKAYTATVERVATGTFFYQCVYLLIHPTPQVVETSTHCTGHFGYKSSTPYMPHLSLLYGDLSEDEKKKAQEKANILDECISGLSFPVTRLALYKTDTEDKTLKSWGKITECTLDSN